VLVNLCVNARDAIPHGRVLMLRTCHVDDVRVGPDGAVYLLTDAEEGEVLRLRPAKP
jgi:glucose/arabinose dehydrogenase